MNLYKHTEKEMVLSQSGARASTPELPMIEGAVPVTWKRGTVIFRETGAPGAMFFLRSGKVKLVKKDKFAKNFLLGLLRPGDTLGLHAVLNYEPYSSTAVAIEDSSAVRIDASHFYRWFQQHPGGFQQVMRLLCVELGRAEERINAMMRVSASARLAEVLLMIESVYGVDSEGRLAIVLRPKEYADLTNVARGTIYRLFKRFVDDRLISMEGTKIGIVNRERLRHLAGL